MDAISASCLGRPGGAQAGVISYQLSGTLRKILTVIASVPRSVAHHPPAVLVSIARRPAMVVFGSGGCGRLVTVHGPSAGRPRLVTSRRALARAGIGHPGAHGVD